MGSASSRMSASPTLIQTIPGASHPSASITSDSSPQRQSTLGLKLERSDPVHTPASAPSSSPQTPPVSTPHLTLPSISRSKPNMATIIHPSQTPDLKGKGKHMPMEEKEEGEISEEDEVYKIWDVDRWRPSVESNRALHSPRPTSRDAQRHSYSKSFDRKGTKRAGQSSAVASSSSTQRSTSKSPINHQLSPPTSTSHRHSIVSDATTTTSSTPSSDSLALPESVNPDEAAQYMDIIRNLITDGISPDALLKRGATRKYVLAVCEDLASFGKLGSLHVQSGAGAADFPSSDIVAEPSLLHGDTLHAIDMNRHVSSSSASSVEVSDVIDRVLSPRQSQRPVPSSSWKPSVASSSSYSDVPLVRTDTYKPQSRVTATGPTVSGIAPALSQLSHNATPFVTALPRPVSSYVPSNPRAGSFPSRMDGDLGDSSSITPILGLGRPTQTTLPSAIMSSDSSPSAATASETLAERKKRVLESMRRARKPNPVASGFSTGTSTPVAAAGDSTPPLATAPQDATAFKAKFDLEVAALEREVMGLHDAKADIEVEAEEGEITPSVTPQPLPISEPLPIRATLNTSTASTNLTNGVRMNRTNKRPHAEDLMENRATSAKPTYPVRKRPFGRPLPYQYLLVRLDDSDDEKETRPVRKTPPPSDAERLRLEEDIKRLKALIEARRLTKAVKAKSEKAEYAPVVPSDSLRKPVAEATEEDMDVDDDEPADSLAAKSAVMQASLDLSTMQAQSIDLPTASSSTLPVGDDDAQIINTNPDSTASLSSVATMTPQTSSITSNTTATVQGSSVYSFREYQSLLKRYPLLPNSVKSRAITIQSATSDLTSGLDQQLLSSIVLTSVNKRNPCSVICGAEAAGGTCADPSCQDLHFGRELARPDEHAIIEYINQVSGSRLSPKAVEASLRLAKEALGSLLEKENGGIGVSKTKTKLTTFSLPVAEQLVARAGHVLDLCVEDV